MKPVLIIDFDSTFIKLETIEVLADFSLSNKKNKVQILNKIKHITNKAMIGDIPFSQALEQRIQLINPSISHINKTIEFLKSQISDSFLKNKNKLYIDKNNPLSKNNGKNIVVKNISGNNIIVGDGYTDYEVKKDGNAKKFIQFTENINRKSLNNKADLICNDFKKIISYINNDI